MLFRSTEPKTIINKNYEEISITLKEWSKAATAGNIYGIQQVSISSSRARLVQAYNRSQDMVA